MATRQLEKYKWTKDGRKWVFYAYTPTLDGKRKKYTSQAYKTKKEALEAEAEYALKYSGKPLDDSITFKQLYTLYYEYQLDKVKQTTIKTYQDRNFKDAELGIIPSPGSKWTVTKERLDLLLGENENQEAYVKLIKRISSDEEVSI